MKILKFSEKEISETINQAIKAIKAGKAVVLPTDTVYGLTANAVDRKAVENVFKIKKRAKNKPVPIFVKDIKAAKKLALIGKKEEKFLKKVWPGKNTVVLNRKRKEKIYGIARKTIALRIPDYKLISLLLKKTNFFLVGTSANISGKPAATEIKQVLSQFKNQKHRPDLFINAGNLKTARPSTVFDLTGLKPKIIRK